MPEQNTTLKASEKNTPPQSGERPVLTRRINFRKEDTKVWQEREKITKLVQDKNVDTILLDAATGTGKTFAGSQIVLEALGPQGKMVMTENLRRATEKSAEDVAADREEEPGDVVGYQNKYHRMVSKNTRLLFCPMQSLLNKVEKDNTLSEFDLIMVDEVHKESKQNEILLATLRDIQTKRKASGRPLKLILTSATMDKEKLKKYFKGDGVEKKVVEEVVVAGENIHFEPKWHSEKIPMNELPKAAAEKVRYSIQDQKDTGNILVFLSGKAQIDEAKLALENMKLGDNIEIVRYMGTLTKQEQEVLVNKMEKEGKRLVILATNAAQESLTLPLKVVIDTCTHKHQMFDPVTGKSYLVEEPAPLDHLTQRKGRVGRVKPAEGEPPDKYYPLTTKDDWEGRPKFETPEIERTDLSSEVLTMVASGYDPYRKDFFINTPYATHIDSAFKRLERLGAWDGKNLTAKGKLMAELQLNINNASLVADGIKYGSIEDSVRLATMLEIFSNSDAFEGSSGLLEKMRGNEKSDLTPLIHLLKNFQSAPNKIEWAQEQGLRADKLSDVDALFTSIMGQIGHFKSPTDESGIKAGGKGLDLAIYDSFADTRITGFQKHYLRMNGVGGEVPLTMDNHSALAVDSALIYDEFVSANIRTLSKHGEIDSRMASLNHVLSDEAKEIIRAKEQINENTSKQSSENHELPTETKHEEKTEEVASTAAHEEVPQPLAEENKEEVPKELPPKPLKWYQKVNNWFKTLGARIRSWWNG